MDISIANTVVFSGHRNEKLPQTPEGLDQLKVVLHKEIDKAIGEGYNTFLFGGCRGFDLLAAQQVLNRQRTIKKGDPSKLTLIAVVPFEGQANRWRDADRETYYRILPQCHEVITIMREYEPSACGKRNRWMIQHASRLICYHDGSRGGTDQTVLFARQCNLPVYNLFEFLKGRH